MHLSVEDVAKNFKAAKEREDYYNWDNILTQLRNIIDSSDYDSLISRIPRTIVDEVRNIEPMSETRKKIIDEINNLSRKVLDLVCYYNINTTLIVGSASLAQLFIERGLSEVSIDQVNDRIFDYFGSMERVAAHITDLNKELSEVLALSVKGV